MNNINENNKILNISFNQDNSCFSLSTERGFKIYETIPLKKEYSRNIDGGIKQAELYYRSNILALIGGGDHPKFNPKKLIIWDDSLNQEISNINFFTYVKNVKLKKDKIYVICEKNICVFNLKTMENIEIIITKENPKGLFCISSDENNDIIAYIGMKENNDSNKKYVNIKNYETLKEIEINTQEEILSYISLNHQGNLLAVANEKGINIKIYNCLNGDLLGDLYRGKEKAEIHYICFDKLSNYLALTSDRGTIHIWTLKRVQQKLIESNNNDIKEIKKEEDESLKNKENKENIIIDEIDELPENKKKIFSKNEKSFAQIRLNSKKSICSFQENNIIVVITHEGIYYQVKLEPKHGGNCQIIQQKELKIFD